MTTKVVKDAKIIIGLSGDPRENETAYNEYINQMNEIKPIFEEFKEKIIFWDVSGINEKLEKFIKEANKLSGRGPKLIFPTYLVQYYIYSNNINEFISAIEKIRKSTDKYKGILAIILFEEDPDLENNIYTIRDYFEDIEKDIESEKIQIFLTVDNGEFLEKKELKEKVEQYCEALYGSKELKLPIFVANFDIYANSIEEFKFFYEILK